jgi:type II secretory pathway pseudopilin PulG
LIELLVVMSMIGLLISILIPSLKQSMQLAAETICKHNLREIGHCLELYRTEHDGWLPTPEESSVGIESVGKRRPWFVKLYPMYLPDPMILTCPEDPFRNRMITVGPHLSDDYIAEYASYGMNRFVASAGGGFVANVDRHQPSRPHDTILLADLGPDVAVGSSVVEGLSGPIRNGSLLTWDDGFDPFTGFTPRPWLTRRHGRGINVATLEGGVREAQTWDIMRRPIGAFYDKCAAGGCTFCNELHLPHYSFARDHLYWWSGQTPTE